MLVLNVFFFNYDHNFYKLQKKHVYEAISLKRVTYKSEGLQRIVTIGLLATPKFLPRNVCSNLDAMTEN